MPDEIFDPLSYDNIGRSIVTQLLSRHPVPLGSLVHVYPTQAKVDQKARFAGPGIYCIYYSGSRPEYEPVAVRNRNSHFDAPIYVGKADPPGARKGVYIPDENDAPLFERLVMHARSIHRVDNLDLVDFHCRYLVLVDTWTVLGERHLITRFKPVWNLVADGFGSNAPGKGREEGKRSRWDTIHPGRGWAKRLKDNALSDTEIWIRIERALAGDTTVFIPREDQIEEATSDED